MAKIVEPPSILVLNYISKNVGKVSLIFFDYIIALV